MFTMIGFSRCIDQDLASWTLALVIYDIFMNHTPPAPRSAHVSTQDCSTRALTSKVHTVTRNLFPQRGLTSVQSPSSRRRSGRHIRSSLSVRHHPGQTSAPTPSPSSAPSTKGTLAGILQSCRRLEVKRTSQMGHMSRRY